MAWGRSRCEAWGLRLGQRRGAPRMARSRWGVGGGMEEGSLGISDMPKRGVSRFHVEVVGPSAEDCLEGNFVPTNDPLFQLPTHEYFSLTTQKSKVKFLWGSAF